MLTASERAARRNAMNRKRNMKAMSPSKLQMAIMKKRLHAQNKQTMAAIKSLSNIPRNVRDLIIKNVIAGYPFKRARRV
jgi:hypothetical protein